MQMTIEWTHKAQNIPLSPLLKYQSVHLTSQQGELMVLMVLAFSDSAGAAQAPVVQETPNKKKKDKVQVVLFSELYRP